MEEGMSGSNFTYSKDRWEGDFMGKGGKRVQNLDVELHGMDIGNKRTKMISVLIDVEAASMDSLGRQSQWIVLFGMYEGLGTNVHSIICLG